MSGRGVGMDVVRVIANRLGGSVSVPSEPGRGTKVLLDLPLSLALDARRAGVGQRRIAGDSDLADPSHPRCARPSSPHNGRLPLYRGRRRDDPARAARRRARSRRGVGAIEQAALIIEARGSRVGHQRRCGARRTGAGVPGAARTIAGSGDVAGAAILGNGEIVPILDVQAIVERAMHSRSPRRRSRVVSPPSPAPAAGFWWSRIRSWRASC